MILADYQIRQLCEHGFVDPFNESLINPASIDVRIGNTLMIESAEGLELKKYPINDHTEDSPYELTPGQFCLASTLEKFNMPCNVAGEFRLKSSKARMGYDQALAVWLDPGWSGSVLTMELKNNRQLHRLPLYPGMKIGQIILHRMDKPLKTYLETGRYNGDLDVTGSKD